MRIAPCFWRQYKKTKSKLQTQINKMTSMAVHREGVVAFASLPGGSYAYMIDYENVDGRVWLKSNATEREWCVTPSRQSLWVSLCINSE